LQTGLINAVSAPPSATIGLQWHTRVKHLTKVPLLYTYGTLVISDKAMGKLSTEDQKTLESAFGQALEQLNRNTRSDNQKALKALANQGIRIDEPDTSVIAQWRVTVYEAVAKMSGSQSFNPDLLNRFQSLAKKARGE
jgi:TRAP-type C4-dicarboxylate transport system substrate-binding protein